MVSYSRSPFLLALTDLCFSPPFSGPERLRSVLPSQYNLATSWSPSQWSQCVPPKRPYPPTKWHVGTIQKTIWVFTTVKTWGFLWGFTTLSDSSVEGLHPFEI
jgi:hypothetical protein